MQATVTGVAMVAVRGLVPDDATVVNVDRLAMAVKW